MWQIRGGILFPIQFPIIANLGNMQAFWGLAPFATEWRKGAVDRFRDLLKKKEHKLFITIIVNFDYNYDKNFIINFNNILSKYTSNYTLLFISHIPDKEQNKHEFTYHDNIHFLELHTLSQSNGLKFLNNKDNIYLDNIIKSNYNFIPL